MSTLTPPAPGSREALISCVSALRRVAEYKLDPALDRRMLELGERKEYLSPDEHAELMALVTFSQTRTVEKLDAELALRRLESAFPELAGAG
jgi:hypothetical protein